MLLHQRFSQRAAPGRARVRLWASPPLLKRLCSSLSC